MNAPIGPVRFCPYCGTAARLHPKTRMHDCTGPSCRVRFHVGSARRKRKAPAREERTP